MVRDYSIDSVKGVCLLHMFVLHIFIISLIPQHYNLTLFISS